jgi:cellulose synthase operon protein YhjQ
MPVQLPPGSLSVLPSGGGVGASTIIATLGRIFALRKERVLLLDGDPASVLPFFFGVTAPVRGTCLLQERLSAAEHSIRVVLRKQEETIPSEIDAGPARESDASLWGNAASLLGETDRVFVDVWADMAGNLRRQLLLESNSLVVLLPDLRSALRVRTLLRLFEEQQRVHGGRFTPYFLLNQFDPTVSLHQELRRSFGAQLGERLLPFTLRRTDEVALALAEGMTVVDHAPGSGITEDYLQLANWLAMWQGTEPDSCKAREAGACS